MKSIEEQIRKAAVHFDNNNFFTNSALYDGFIAGAEWERKRDRWISVEDEKPDCVCILVASKGLVLTMNYINGEYYYGSSKWVDQVTHWMPCPNFPNRQKGR